jgi:hypothetical protein
MIPADFEYYRPKDMAGVLSVLAEHGDDARVMAGGHSLIPMMKLRMADVPHLIDLQDVGGLSGIEVGADSIRLGAMVMTITAALAARNVGIKIGGHDVVLQGRMAWVAGGSPVMLTGRERQILQVLLQRNGAVVPKSELLHIVWGENESDPHVVEVTMGRLRRRLGPAGAGIETVIRRGYRASPV